MTLGEIRIRTGEKNPFFGKHHSEETKRIISEKKKRWYETHEAYWTGKKRPEETNKKISESRIGCISPMKGKHLTFEQRKILSEQKLRNKSVSWKGGKRRDRGYIRLISPDHSISNKATYTFEHRIIVEKYLGRSLSKSEQVHHINHKRDDNRKENLMVFCSVSAHRRFENNKQVSPEEIIFDGRD